MDTNSIGDIAEQAVILKAMEFGWGVSRPLGNRLPYDLVLDIESQLFRIQFKSAWFDKSSENYIGGPLIESVKRGGIVCLPSLPVAMRDAGLAMTRRREQTS